MHIGILGAGMVGRAMALDLIKKYQVTSFDICEQSLQCLTQKNPGIKTMTVDIHIPDCFAR